MPRRISLAAALALTTIVTFALIAIGAQAGIFSDSKPSNASAAADAPSADVPAVPPAAEAPAAAAADVAPQVIVQTEYVEVFDPPAPANTAGATAAANKTPGSDATPLETAPATQMPASTPTALVTATAAALATATMAAPVTATPPTPSASSLPKEIEFVGTVTAIDGNQVTFSHGGSLTTVQVSNPGALSVGVTAHVHALLKSIGYIATEVDVGG